MVSCYSVMRVASSSAHLVCRLREVNEQLSRVSAGEARALFEQEVGAHTHTHTQNGTASLYYTSLLAGRGTKETGTGGDNCCTGQRYLFC